MPLRESRNCRWNWMARCKAFTATTKNTTTDGKRAAARKRRRFSSSSATITDWPHLRSMAKKQQVVHPGIHEGH